MNYILRLKGGAGSGFHGHKGIPGHRGGSLPRGEFSSGIKSSNPSPKTPEEWGTKMAANSRYRNMNDVEFADEVASLLEEKFPHLKMDKINDVVQSAINQRKENWTEGNQRSSTDKYFVPDYSEWTSQKTKFGVDYTTKVGKYKLFITHMSDGRIRGRIEDTSLDFSDNNRISDFIFKSGSEQALLYKFRSRLEGLNSRKRNIHGDFVS